MPYAAPHRVGNNSTETRQRPRTNLTRQRKVPHPVAVSSLTHTTLTTPPHTRLHKQHQVPYPVAEAIITHTHLHQQRNVPHTVVPPSSLTPAPTLPTNP